VERIGRGKRWKITERGERIEYARRKSTVYVKIWITTDFFRIKKEVVQRVNPTTPTETAFMTYVSVKKYVLVAGFPKKSWTASIGSCQNWMSIELTMAV
jgi:hypothetical protein